jgi:hypothetical protein
MKAHRRKLLVALTAAAVAGSMLLAGQVWLSQPHPRINRSSFTKIRPGMTLEEVEALLGAPAGSQSPRTELFNPEIYVADAKRSLPAAAACRYEWWSGDCSLVVVQFGTDGKATAKIYLNIGRVSLRDRVWQWTGW